MGTIYTTHTWENIVQELFDSSNGGICESWKNSVEEIFEGLSKLQAQIRKSVVKELNDWSNEHFAECRNHGILSIHPIETSIFSAECSAR